MQWQMDFRKLKKGDEFSVLMSREMLDGKREQSQLLGVRFVLKVKIIMPSAPKTANSTTATVRVWRRIYAIPNGASVPRLSNFNPRRLNPVTGRVAPHRGVDFAMPQGTPVLAVGDGEEVVAKRSGAAGLLRRDPPRPHLYHSLHAPA